VSRAKGPDVWMHRWRDSKRIQRKKVLSNVKQFRTKADAKCEVENFRAQINSELEKIGRMTLGDLAPGSKAKIRNDMSALFSHCIRHELYTKLNPIASVRQSAVRQRDPDILTLDEMRAILENIEPLAIRVMVAVAAASALRRSEMRGLKWDDPDFDARWINLRRGLVRKHETQMKTKASRKGVPMAPELAELLLRWREATPYSQSSDWVFASPFTQGKRPYWPDSALKDHIRPAALKAGRHQKRHRMAHVSTFLCEPHGPTWGRRQDCAGTPTARFLQDHTGRIPAGKRRS
jgi:integrase